MLFYECVLIGLMCFVNVILVHFLYTILSVSITLKQDLKSEHHHSTHDKRRKTSGNVRKLILLYKVKKDKIPQSQFNKIQKIYFKTSLFPIVIFISWLSSYTIIFQKDIAKKILFFQDLNLYLTGLYLLEV